MRISDWSSDVCSSDLPYPLRDSGAGRTHSGSEARSMIHNYVERRGAESHGSWSVGKGRAGVLVQLTAGFDQTRIAISPDDALRLADQLMELALKAMNGLSGQRGDRRSDRKSAV